MVVCAAALLGLARCYSNGLGANMDEEVAVEFIGGPLDGERHLFALADLFPKLGTGELCVSSQSEDGYHSYWFARKGPDGLEYRYAGENE